MKIRCKVSAVIMFFLLLIQHIISGCATKVPMDVHRKDLYREETDSMSRNLFQEKCSLCHGLPDIDAYTPDDWTSIIDIVHDTKAAKKFITEEESQKIKTYLVTETSFRYAKKGK